MRTQVLSGGQRVRAVFRGNWGYLCAAVGCILTFVLLFQPWLATGTAGTDGSIYANAFGRLHVTTFYVDLWAQTPPPTSSASGVWGILTSVAIFVAVCSLVVNWVTRTEVLTHVATVATFFVAVLTIATAVYLDSKGDDLTRAVSFGSARDPGTQIGLLLRWAKGHSTYPAPGFRQVSWATASLTSYVVLACAISMASTMAAVAQWIQGRRNHRA
ncbi:hypothetical protein [Nocardia australiensis]|uniref:hypothetical protein n=1 Tax=Nocardia australiensis TaxID=2887191 RepID=UPI001D15D20E|nr:hypothetical protein [Nocardia australiensis]